MAITRKNLKRSSGKWYYRERKEYINSQLLALKKKKKSTNLPGAPCQSSKQQERAPLVNQVSNMGMHKNPPPPS